MRDQIKPDRIITCTCYTERGETGNREQIRKKRNKRDLDI